MDNLADSKLERLSFLGNLVQNLPNYRYYVISRIPTLKILDFQKITKQERKMAKQMFKGDIEQNKYIQEMKQRQMEISENLKLKENKLLKSNLISQNSDLDAAQNIQLQIKELERQLEKAENLKEIELIEQKI